MMENPSLPKPRIGSPKDPSRAAMSIAIFAATSWALLPAGLIALRGHRTYDYLNPFVAILALCCLAGIAAIIKKANGVVLVRNCVTVMAFGLFVLTMAHFPGGDDGPGMILIGGSGPAVLAGAILAIASTVQLVRYRQGDREDTLATAARKSDEAKIRVLRISSFADRFRAYRIEVDGVQIGRIRGGETVEFPVSTGHHAIAVGIDWCGSPSIAFDISPGETLAFECNSNVRGPRFLLAFIYAMFLHHRWLTLRLIS